MPRFSFTRCLFFRLLHSFAMIFAGNTSTPTGLPANFPMWPDWSCCRFSGWPFSKTKKVAQLLYSIIFLLVEIAPFRSIHFFPYPNIFFPCQPRGGLHRFVCLAGIIHCRRYKTIATFPLPAGGARPAMDSWCSNHFCSLRYIHALSPIVYGASQQQRCLFS